ncbi:MAG: hypothetical protein ACFFD4_20070 [Candidatus Odinarchaeota archaeon]
MMNGKELIISNNNDSGSPDRLLDDWKSLTEDFSYPLWQENLMTTIMSYDRPELKASSPSRNVISFVARNNFRVLRPPVAQQDSKL